MGADAAPQIYLITPPEVELSSFPDRLARVLDGADIACVRVALSSTDESQVSKTADVLREVCHARDVAIVIDRHLGLVAPLGLDGVHLADGARSVRAARKALGADAIVGAFCGTSRHDGMTAGEAGADYVSFGPVSATALGDGTVAEYDLLEWWSQMIEVPVVAEGAVDAAHAARLSEVTDFIALGQEIWRAADPLAALNALRVEFA